MKTFSKRPAPGERGEPVSCPVCGSGTSRPLWDLGDCRFVRCAVCGHVYQNPRPTPRDLARRYDEEYLEYEIRNAQGYLDLMLLGLRDLGFWEVEAGLPEDRCFLDVGCATGALVEYAARRGWKAEGVEVCGPAAEYGRKVRGVMIREGTLEDAAFPEAWFDVVHSSHVIEHVPEPGAFLAEIRRILKPGGWCVTVTPNRTSLQAALFGSGWRSVIPDHMHLFSRPGILRLIRDSGLEPLRTVTWGGIARGLAPAPLKAVLDRSAKLFGFGDVLAVLARKPAAPD